MSLFRQGCGQRLPSARAHQAPPYVTGRVVGLNARATKATMVSDSQIFSQQQIWRQKDEIGVALSLSLSLSPAMPCLRSTLAQHQCLRVAFHQDL